jgi:phage tail sheath protein FI
MLVNPNGSGQSNSTVVSYKTAINVMTDPMSVNVNILAIPGIRESFLTEYAAQKVRDYGLAYYVMDLPAYDDTATRLYDDSTARPDVDKTTSAFDSRAIDNNYAGAYFPDVFVDDTSNKRRVKMPSSVAALGALAFNDRVTYPWFAPAGFNRAALDFVTNVTVRLNSTDRDRLYESRINPIAVFPRLGFVIWGQKTMQVNKSALDRVNVRRLLLEVKRIVIGTAKNLVFEQNTPEVRNKFVSDSTLQLGLIQAQAGIENFRVVMNETNNTQEDIDLNRLNGKIVVQPTRTIEYIAIDFIITNAGVQFV